MSISGIATPVAFRTQTTPAATLNAATSSSTPQQTGRAHHHHGGAKGSGTVSTADNSRSGATTNGSLLDTLV